MASLKKTIPEASDSEVQPINRRNIIDPISKLLIYNLQNQITKEIDPIAKPKKFEKNNYDLFIGI